MKIQIVTPKGGAGKTTTTLGLASTAFFRKDLRPLVVDCDRQRSSCMTLATHPLIGSQSVPVEDLPKLFKSFSNGTAPEADVYLFDMPPRDEHIAVYTQVAKRVDFTLIPLNPSKAAMESPKVLMKAFSKAGINNYACVFSMVPPAGPARRRVQKMRDTIRAAGVPVLDNFLTFRAEWSRMSFEPRNNLIHLSNNGDARHEIEKIYTEVEGLVAVARSEAVV